MTRARWSWRLVGLSLLILLSAHVTAMGAGLRRNGWIQFVPSTLLVLRPMNVTGWTEAQWNRNSRAVTPPVLYRELGRRLNWGYLWSWQEWILFKRVESACRARDDYGIMPRQYNMAVTLATTPAKPSHEETEAVWLARIAGSVDVPFLIDHKSLEADGWDEDHLMSPASFHGSVADALDHLCSFGLWTPYAHWDITPQGVVVTSESQAASTSRSRIYDVSDLATDLHGCRLLMDLVRGTVEPDVWIDHGGSVNGGFACSGHLVITASARTHFQVENLLVDLRDAVRPGSVRVRPDDAIDNPRAFTIRSEQPAGILAHLRAARRVSVEALRRAGPAFENGVTADELRACNRAAFGLIDTIRRQPGDQGGPAVGAWAARGSDLD